MLNTILVVTLFKETF